MGKSKNYLLNIKPHGKSWEKLYIINTNYTP